MARAHKFGVVERQHGRRAADKLGVVDHLDAILARVEQMQTAQRAENLVVGVVDHIVRAAR